MLRHYSFVSLCLYFPPPSLTVCIIFPLLNVKSFLQNPFPDCFYMLFFYVMTKFPGILFPILFPIPMYMFMFEIDNC